LMMLTPGVNSKLQDIEPAKKVETYRTSGLLASIEVAQLIEKGTWNKASVEARGRRLLSWARTEWGD
jgi:Protein of unknown function (DUF1524)